MAINAVPKPSFNDASPPLASPPGPIIVGGGEIEILEKHSRPLAKGLLFVERVFRTAREQVRYMAEHYPLQVIIGLGASAFVGGVALRIWRSNGYARKQTLFRKWRS